MSNYHSHSYSAEHIAVVISVNLELDAGAVLACDMSAIDLDGDFWISAVVY
jgi:hypothetical protein